MWLRLSLIERHFHIERTPTKLITGGERPSKYDDKNDQNKYWWVQELEDTRWTLSTGQGKLVITEASTGGFGWIY